MKNRVKVWAAIFIVFALIFLSKVNFAESSATDNYSDDTTILAVPDPNISINLDNDVSLESDTIIKNNMPNVIIITLDTLRADHLHFLGYERETTPFLDEFAKNATVFENAHSALPLTTPSHTTMFTGLYPIENGVRSQQQKTNSTLLAEILSKEGYETAAFVSAKPTEPLSRGFDLFNINTTKSEQYNSSEEFTQEKVRQNSFRRNGTQTLESFSDWINATDTEKPLFLWVHFYDAHSPYISEYKDKFGGNMSYDEAISCIQLKDVGAPKKNVTSNYSQQFCQDQIVKLYDGGVYTVDLYTKEVLTELDKKGLLNNSIIMIASDHGENLGERYSYFHGGDVYDTTTHVPLIIKTQGNSAERISQDVSLVSITPTVLDYLGINQAEEFSGPSLLPLIKGEEVSTPSFIESSLRKVTRNVTEDDELKGIVRNTDRIAGCSAETECNNILIKGRRIAVAANEKKLIYNAMDSIEFYDLKDDPVEAHNLYGLVDTSEYENLLDSWIILHDKNKTVESNETLDSESLEALKALGYMN